MSTGDVLPQNSFGDGGLTAGLASHRILQRPNLVRRDTDQILSYYQSEHAGRGPYDISAVEDNTCLSMPLSRRNSLSSRSNTPSEYSSDSHQNNEQVVKEDLPRSQPPPTSAFSHTRRSSVPSEGGSDRRRLAIVEMDSSAPLSGFHKRSRLDESEERSGSSSRLLSRRGLHVNDLALIAPPDASPKTYTDLTPPPSAPIVAERIIEHVPTSGHHRSASEATYVGARSRLHHKTSRDIGIVGTGGIYSITEGVGASVDLSRHDEYDGLKVPIFQTPAKSRSPSPSATPDLSDSATTSFNESYHATPATASTSMRTPEIGEGKDVGQPVIGPVVMGLNTEGVMRRQPSNPTIHISPSLSPPRQPVSPFVFYEPGVHSTAGPLPPPPRSVFEDDSPVSPPPRPPRLRTPLPPNAHPLDSKAKIEALKESLQLPESVSVVLASRSSSRNVVTRQRQDSELSDASHYTDENESKSADESHHHAKRTKSIHRREGAFPPSSSSVSPSLPLADSDQNRQSYSEDVNPPTLLSETIRLCPEPADITSGEGREATAPSLHREPSWVSLRQEMNRIASPNGGSASSESASIRRSMPKSPSVMSSSPPPPPKHDSWQGGEFASTSKPGNSLKVTLSNLKRFSALPRTPSFTSLSVASRSQRSRTPSPSYPRNIMRSPKPRIKTRYPAALQCQDIVGKKNASERIRLYADRINELAMYDCGLGDWVMTMKLRGTGSRPAQINIAQVTDGEGPALPSSVTINTQPRVPSHGSMASEATFPIRPDASTATDLSSRATGDASSTRSPPPLPYPSLATTPRPPKRTSTLLSPSSSSPRTYQVPLSTGPKASAIGFFASIGRKTSVRKDRGVNTGPSPNVLTKRLPNAKSNPSPPRQIQVTTPPSVPGGPRAVPNKMHRSQTLSMAPPPKPVAPEPVPVSRRNTHRASALNRRPSLFSRSLPAQAQSTSPQFEQQVDKLADLLPHADRQILAAYLRRTGQDMLAIGQYLEDEKSGTLRYD
ncbi:unnamed protein product [Somion occarium]|uniref:Uncharacterized protein n=2 Tax=Somion occarium TaxID=3059160 RepID=A0ABP1D4U0_9APHY